MVPLSHYLILSAVLFTLGVVGAMTRKNAIVVFMSLELMLNAVNLSLVTFSRFLDSMDGQIAVFLVMTVAAAEAAIGLALVVAIYRTKQTICVDELRSMQG
jgi:NADH-quinone oxidoreductase subunit K